MVVLGMKVLPVMLLMVGILKPYNGHTLEDALGTTLLA